MADNLPNATENSLLNLLLRGTAFTVTTPVRARLMTANGTDTTSGTELGTSQGYTSGGQDITFGTVASGGSISNTVACAWTNMPASTIVGLEIWSTDATPKRLWWGPLSASKPVSLGDPFEFSIGDVSCSLA